MELSLTLRMNIRRDVKLLVILNGKIIDRLWLPSEQERPVFKGVTETTLYLPISFLGTENRLNLLVEAMIGEPELVEMLFKKFDQRFICLRH